MSLKINLNVLEIIKKNTISFRFDRKINQKVDQDGNEDDMRISRKI